MSNDLVGFGESFQRHLPEQERKAILAALATEFPTGATLGEIVDAAQALGSRRCLDDLRLLDLAESLLTEDDLLQAKDAQAEEASGSKRRKKVEGTKRTRAKRGAVKLSTDDVESTLIPLIQSLGQASMQMIEEETGQKRQYLRGPINELVEQGRLLRVGKGRGTCYTVPEE